MNWTRRILTSAAALAAAGLLTGNQAEAQAAFPTQTVRIVVPFSAGSITDILARLIADKLAENWKFSVIVENRPGIPGTLSVANSQPDGHTLMLTSNGHTIAAVINKDLPFHPVKSFAGVTVVASVPLVMIAPPDMPANNVNELIELARKQPGKLNFASAGVASTSFLSGAVFRQAANVDIVHVPYRGLPEMANAVIRGEVSFGFTSVPSAQSLADGKKVKMLAVNSQKRVPQLPDLPTIAEAALPSFDYDSWFGIMAPAGTPQAIVNKVSADIAAALKLPDVSSKMMTMGSIPAPNKPAEFDKIIAADTERYTKLLQAAGVGAKK
jgi:tripartite-type tricarboxylate transporter receptor subunit TctC